MEDYRKYLSPEVLASITSLELRAHLVVEGFMSGLNASPFHGLSVEFAQHREYSPGDDIRHIDWRVYARSDRYYIKEFEEETNLKCHILLDISESMRYRSGTLSKLDYGATVAASLAYLQLMQKDAVGMYLFDTELRKVFPPSNKPSYLKEMLHGVLETRPVAKTDVAPIFHRMAEEVKRRGMIILISDLFVNLDDLLRGLEHFRFKRHEVLVFQILDERELTFPFRRNTLFKGMEGYPNLMTEPRSLRRAYLDAIGAHNQEARSRCVQEGVDFLTLSTVKPLNVALSSFLARRALV